MAAKMGTYGAAMHGLLRARLSCVAWQENRGSAAVVSQAACGFRAVALSTRAHGAQMMRAEHRRAACHVVPTSGCRAGSASTPEGASRPGREWATGVILATAAAGVVLAVAGVSDDVHKGDDDG